MSEILLPPPVGPREPPLAKGLNLGRGISAKRVGEIRVWIICSLSLLMPSWSLHGPDPECTISIV